MERQNLGYNGLIPIVTFFFVLLDLTKGRFYE